MSNEIKKYSFFKPLEKISDIKGEYSYYSLSNLNISDIKVLGKYIYLSCRIKKLKKIQIIFNQQNQVYFKFNIQK